jgi:hypothetical protein
LMQSLLISRLKLLQSRDLLKHIVDCVVPQAVWLDDRNKDITLYWLSISWSGFCVLFPFVFG